MGKMLTIHKYCSFQLFLERLRNQKTEVIRWPTNKHSGLTLTETEVEQSNIMSGWASCLHARLNGMNGT